MEELYLWIDGMNNVLWSYVLIEALLDCALWFTVRTRGVQFRMVGGGRDGSRVERVGPRAQEWRSCCWGVRRCCYSKTIGLRGRRASKIRSL